MNFFSVIIATVLLASTNVAVAQGVPVAGTHFREFVAGQSTPRPGRLEVIEFFMYSCVHCAAFNKESEAWSKNLPKNIVFTRMPVAFSDSKLPHSRMYFALKAMGKQDELHHEIFSAIHDENKNLLVPGEQADYLAQFGVDRAKYLENYKSFAVQAATQRAAALFRQHELNEVPAISVDGRYVTSAGMAGGASEMLRVADYMLDLVQYGVERAQYYATHKSFRVRAGLAGSDSQPSRDDPKVLGGAYRP